MVGRGARPRLSDRERLPYVEATLTEVLRVSPTAPGSLTHHTIRETQVAGYTLPKGTEVRFYWRLRSNPDATYPKHTCRFGQNLQIWRGR